MSPSTKLEKDAFFWGKATSKPPNFTIKIGQYQWGVHTRVLSRQSKFFKKLFAGPFKESSERVVTLHDDCPWIIGRMLNFFYSGHCLFSVTDIPESELHRIMERGLSPNQELPELATDKERGHAQVTALLYQVADKYEHRDLTAYLRPMVAHLLESHGTQLQEVVDCFGITTFQQDSELSSKCIVAILNRHRPKTTVAYEELKRVFETNTEVMAEVHTQLALKCEQYANRCNVLEGDREAMVSNILDAIDHECDHECGNSDCECHW